MLVSICMGVNSQTIENELNKKFRGGTLEFTSNESLDGLMSDLSKGQKLDRILISDSAWENKMNHAELRDTIHRFVGYIQKHMEPQNSVLFVCRSSDDAHIIFEETIEISNQSCILYIKPKEDGVKERLSLKLLSDFVTKDLDNLKDYFYDPDIDLRKQRKESEGLDYSSETIVGSHISTISEVDTDALDIEEPDELEEIEDASDSSFDDDFGDDFDSYDMNFSDSYYEDETDEDNTDEVEEEDELEESLGNLGGFDHEISTPTREVDDPVENEGFQSLSGIYDEEEQLGEEVEEEPLKSGYQFDEMNQKINFGDEFIPDEDEKPLGNLGMIDDEPLGNLGDDEEEDFTNLDAFSGLDLPNREENEADEEAEDDTITGDLFQQEESSNYQEKEESFVDSDDDLETFNHLKTELAGEEIQQKEEPPKRKKRFIRENKRSNIASGLNEDSLNRILSSFRGRGISIIVTGTAHSGKTLVSYNMANILNRLGCSVLLVDLDLEKAGLSMIDHDTYEIVHSLEVHESSLKKGFNTVTSQVKASAVVLKPALHLLTTGIASLPIKPDKLTEPKKISRFGTAIKNSYNITIFDIPFNSLITTFSDLLGTTDFVLSTVNYSVKSLQEFMIQMSSVEDEDVMDMLFDKTQIVFNHTNQNVPKLFGKKVKGNFRKVLDILDNEVEHVLGFKPDYLFSDMHISGALPDIPNINEYYIKGQVSDTQSGDHLFRHLIETILLRKEIC